MNQVYVIGHKKPDTDSICSAIGYATYLNSREPEKYIPARCGEINPETAHALEFFDGEAPVWIASVEPEIRDLPHIYSVSTTCDMPTIDVVSMMDEHNLRNIPVTDKKGRFRGLISERGLTHAYITRHKIEQLVFRTITLETLARILQAEILVLPRSQLNEGRVYTAIDALHVTLSRLSENDLAIVGDNEPAQLALIQAHIAALIIADGAPVGERVKEAAEAEGVGLLRTPLDAFGVGKMINLSLPAEQVMATDVPLLTEDETIEHAKVLVSDSPYRTACVVGKGDQLIGMISRNTFLQDVHKQVILLDHNEFTQSVDGIETAEIIEIIDHHRLGAISTLRPIRFENEPVGSTSTIIALKFKAAGMEPSRTIAGLLLSGILSDTLVLHLSTTTAKDHEAVAFCTEYAGVDPEEYGTELIGKGMELEGYSIDDLLTRDLKRYDLFGRDVLIGQVMVPTFAYPTEHAEEIQTHLAELQRSSTAYVAVALFTSVFENGSQIFAAGDEGVLAALNLKKQPAFFEGVMSRKNDFFPQFGMLLKSL